jgi:RNA polymerase sigma-70 factor (ECF subfamily)
MAYFKSPIIYDERQKAKTIEIVKKYSDDIVRYSLCYTHDLSSAEDATEEAFAVLFFKKKKFANEQAFKAYLYKVARSKCIDFLRKQKRIVSLEEAISTGDCEQLFEEKQEYTNLYTALEKLPKDYKDVLQLSYIEGFATEEICTILHKNKKQVYNLISRAKVALKPLLEEGDHYEEL